MAISFLFSHSVLYEIFFGKRTEAFTLSAQESLNKIFEMCSIYETCSIFSPAQSVDKIKQGLQGDQTVRFDESLRRENTTLGVNGFTPEGTNTLFESGKALSERGYTILIAKEEEKQSLVINNRTTTITPAEFIVEYNEAQELFDLIDFKEKEFIEFLMLTLFRKDVCKKMRELLGK